MRRFDGDHWSISASDDRLLAMWIDDTHNGVRQIRAGGVSAQALLT